MLGISSGSRTSNIPFQHKWGDPFTNSVCSSLSFLCLVASIGCMYLPNNVFTMFDLPARFNPLSRGTYSYIFTLAMFFETGYSSWWLWWPGGCYLTVRKPFVHIPLSIFVVGADEWWERWSVEGGKGEREFQWRENCPIMAIFVIF